MNPDDLKGKLPKFLPDVHEIRQDICDYLGEARAFDHGVGILLKQLEDIGELENTLFVISGDHGFAGFTNGKCSLYDTGVGVSLAMRWPGNIPPGRVVDDFVNLMDLAPTFLEAGWRTCSNSDDRSQLASRYEVEQVWSDRSQTRLRGGRPRTSCREGTHGQPAVSSTSHPGSKAICTFETSSHSVGQWALVRGTVNRIDRTGRRSRWKTITFACFGDMDASPTKAWLIDHRDEPGMDKYFNYAFGRRPAEELYDVKSDPDQINNVIDDPRYASVRKELSARLMKVLTDANDPRVTGDGTTFEKPPYTIVPPPRKRPERKKRKN